MLLLDAATMWSPGALYILAEPYLLTAFGALISAAIGWLVLIIKQKTGIDIRAADVAKVNSAALNAAGRILASQEGTFANMQIDVKSPLIAEELPKIIASSKPELDRLGMDDDRTKNLVLGKIGVLQATAQGTNPAPPSP